MALAVFLISLAILFYVLLVYPALLRLGVFRKAPPVQAAPAHKSVSLILPVRNGELWIRAKLESIRRLDYPRELLQVIVVSDGSTDGTEQIVRRFAEVQLLSLAPGGKAAALNAGLAQATGEILLFTDARQELDPQSLKLLLAQFSDPTVGVASGELILRKGERAEQDSVGLYWRYEKWIRQQLSRIDSVIGATGAIYAMRRELAGPLPADCLLDDVHLPLQAFFRGFRVIFVAEALAYDHPTSVDVEFWRKVRTLAGNFQLLARFPALLGPRNRMWFHFLSHKFGRLLLPWALLVLAGASGFLARPWGRWLLAAQAAFYGLAALDPWIPEDGRLKRLSSLVRTFVALMLATLAAASWLFLPSRWFWKQPTASGPVQS